MLDEMFSLCLFSLFMLIIISFCILLEDCLIGWLCSVCSFWLIKEMVVCMVNLVRLVIVLVILLSVVVLDKLCLISVLKILLCSRCKVCLSVVLIFMVLVLNSLVKCVDSYVMLIGCFVLVCMCLVQFLCVCVWCWRQCEYISVKGSVVVGVFGVWVGVCRNGWVDKVELVMWMY